MRSVGFLPHHKKEKQQTPKKQSRRLYLTAAVVIIAILAIAAIVVRIQPIQPSSTTSALTSLTISSSATTLSPSVTTATTPITPLTASDFNVSGKVYENVGKRDNLTLEFTITNRLNAPVTYENVSVRLTAIEISNGTHFNENCSGNAPETHGSSIGLTFTCSYPLLPPNIRIVFAKYEIRSYVREADSILGWNITAAVPSNFRY